MARTGRAACWVGLLLGLLTGGAALAAAASSAHAESPPAPFLSGTGLFKAAGSDTLAAGVRPFAPQYPLWSDGAHKRRWIRLPPGRAIDAARADAWDFPPGTRLWKEFSVGQRRIETRMIERLGSGNWRYLTYVWDADGQDAELAPPEGLPALAVSGAPDGRYDVPSHDDCLACHEGAAVPVLGFSALQLSSDRDPQAPHREPLPTHGVDLSSLAAQGLLRNLPAALAERPPRIDAASNEQRAALGYLHANCGHCHNDAQESGAGVPVDLLLAQYLGRPDSSRAVLQSLTGTTSRFRAAAGAAAPKTAATLLTRMRSLDPRVRMPPLGTRVADRAGLALLEGWITRELARAAEPERRDARPTIPAANAVAADHPTDRRTDDHD